MSLVQPATLNNTTKINKHFNYARKKRLIGFSDLFITLFNISPMSGI